MRSFARPLAMGFALLCLGGGMAPARADAPAAAVVGEPRGAAAATAQRLHGPCGALATTERTERDAAKYKAIGVQVRRFLEEEIPPWYAPPRVGARVTAQTAERVMAEADTGLSVPERLSLRLNILAYQTADPETFGYLLWGAARMLALAEPRNPSSQRLLDWCGDLPESDDFHWEGILLRAASLVVAGEPKKAEGIVRPMTKPDQPLTRRAAGCFALGAACEARGEVDKALATYAQVLPYAETLPVAALCALRSSFLLLQGDKGNEARELLVRLGKVPAAVLAAAPVSIVAQVRELADLAAVPDDQSHYWHAWSSWNYTWSVVQDKLGRLSPGQNASSAYAGDVENLARVAEAVAVSGNREALAAAVRSLVETARWQPSAALALSRALDTVALVTPEYHVPLARLAEAVMLASRPKDPEFGRRWQATVTVACLYAGDYGPAAEVAAEYTRDISALRGDESDVKVAHVLAFMNEMGSESARHAPEVLKRLLAVPESPKRARTVQYLAEIYMRRGQQTAARQLLEKEIESPAVKADPPGQKALKTLLERAQKGARGT